MATVRSKGQAAGKRPKRALAERAPETPRDALKAAPDHAPRSRGPAPVDRSIRDALLGGLSKIAQALAHPTRLHLLGLLDHAEHPVERLTELTHAQFATVSAHLKILREAGLVRARREGRYIFYSAAHDEIPRLVSALREVAAVALPEVRAIIEQHFLEGAVIEASSAPELNQQLRRSRFIVLDLRPKDEYLSGHLPRARSFPLNELGARLGELPKTKPLVAYCRGPHCLAALAGVRFLREEGYDARRLAMSVGDWRRAGLPLDA